MPEFRYTILHIHIVFYNFIVDLYKYFKYKKYNEFTDFGKMYIYIANGKQPFGSGKTLSLVEYVRIIYKKYNNVDVWSYEKNCFIKQRIKVYSNIRLIGIPYIPLVSYEQLITCSNCVQDGVVNLFIIDELGSQFNNRDWKTNLSNDLLAAILQQRKSKIALIGTVQDWSLFDATLRKVSTLCIECSKKWRFVVNRKFIASDIERSSYNTELIKPLSVQCFFSTDKIYNSYDTNERVDKLVRDIKNGDMLSNDEILNSSSGNSVELSSLTNVKRKYRKNIKG